MRRQMGTLPADLRKENQRKVMKYLLRNGDATIIEIAEKLNVSRLTVKKCLDYYIEKGIVVTKGKGDSTETGGKKPLLYGFVEDRFMVCVQLHRDAVILSLTNMDNAILASWENSTEEISSLDSFWRITEKLISTHLNEDMLKNILICCLVVPLIVDEKHRLTIATPFEKWPQSDLGKNITEPFENLFPNVILCDVISDCCASGAALIKQQEELEKTSTLVTFYINQGIGGAIFQNGETDNKFGRAFGHIVVCEDDDERCHCGAHGCLEMVLSKRRMRKRIINDKLYSESILSQKDIDLITFKDLFEASSGGDCLANTEMEYCAKSFAMAVRNVVISVEPDCIYVQGDFGKGNIVFRKEVLKQLSGIAIIGDRYNNSLFYDEKDVKKQEVYGAAYLMLMEYIDMLN